MAINLKDILTNPDKKWFRYREDEDMGVVLMEPGEKGDELFALEVQYLTPRELREMMSAGVTRRAIAKQGAKALLGGEDKIKIAICKSQVVNWRMTLGACFHLHLAADLSKQDPKSALEFNDENLETMAKKSELGSLVHEIVSTHANWFDAPPDDDDDAPRTNEQKHEDSPGN